MARRVHVVEIDGELPLSLVCDLDLASMARFVSLVFLVSCLDFVVIALQCSYTS